MDRWNSIALRSTGTTEQVHVTLTLPFVTLNAVKGLILRFAQHDTNCAQHDEVLRMTFKV
jgi:hypothetical protein